MNRPTKNPTRRRLAGVSLLTGLALLGAACGGEQARDEGAAPARPAEGATAPAAEQPAGADSTVTSGAATEAVPAGPAADAQPDAAAPAGATATPAAAPGKPGAKASRPAQAAGSATASPAAGGGTGTAPAQAAGPGAPGGPATPGTGSGGGGGPELGNSDTGVTSKEIKLGSISSVGIPLGNLIVAPITTAVSATMRSVNDQGGILGRKLSIVDCDDGADVTRFRACYRKIVEQDKIFAFITSASMGTGEVHGDLARDRIPWVGSWGFFTSESNDPWMFPVHAATVHEAHATAIWVRDQVKPKTVGILYWNVPEEKLAAKALHEVFDKAGIKVVREIPQELETADESGNVLSIRSANPDHVILFTHPAANVKFMVDAANQGYWPPKGISGNHTITEVMGSMLGKWPLQGLWSISTVRTWGSPGDEYTALMDKYAPQMRKVHHHITQAGYAGVKIFTQAAKEVGPNLTRANLVKTLENRKWDFSSGLGQTYLWNTGDHDNLRCEYIYKYASPDSGSYKVWQPDPDKFQVCDDLD